MLRITSLMVVAILYLIPLNIPLYHIAELSSAGISDNGRLTASVTALLYVAYGAVIFTAVFFTIKFILVENKESDLDKKAWIITTWEKHTKGQKLLNIASICIILLLLLLHMLLMVFDIKLIVMAVLCIIFVYR